MGLREATQGSRIPLTVSLAVVSNSVLAAMIKCFRVLPWQSSGQDSVCPLQKAQVRSSVREVRSHMLHRQEKNKKPISLERVFITGKVEREGRDKRYIEQQT